MKASKIKIMLIENNLDDACFIKNILVEAGPAASEFEMTHVERLSTGLHRLTEDVIDVVLLDLSLPDSQGLETLTKVQAQVPDMPIVVLSGLDNEALATKVVSAGAQDYLVKGEINSDLLARSTRHAIERKRTEEALRETETRLRTIIDNNLDGIIIADKQGTVRFVNPAAELLYQCQPGELLGALCDFPLIPGETAEHSITDRPNCSESAIVEIRVVETAWQGEAVYLASLRDITSHKQAAADLERSLRAERKQRLLAETLREVSLALTSQTGHEAVLDEILRQAKRIVPYKTAHIMLLEGNILRAARWRGHEVYGNQEYISGLIQRLTDLPLDSDVVRTQKAFVMSDAHQEPRWIKYKESAWIRSHITVPICHRNHVLGLLRLDSDIPEAFTMTHAESLQPLTNAAAIALENSRLYEQAQQDAETKETLLREVNHRVKNNLSAIIGLLYAERRHSGPKNEANYRSIVDDLITRVRGLATAHNLLSASEWQPLLITDLTRQAIHAALQALPPNKHVSVNINNSLVRVTPKQASSLALVLSELATNTVKYCLSGQDTAYISARISLENSFIVVEYRDNGPGYPEEVLRFERHNVGLYLIKTLVSDGLQGKLSLRNDHGAITTVQLKCMN